MSFYDVQWKKKKTNRILCFDYYFRKHIAKLYWKSNKNAIHVNASQQSWQYIFVPSTHKFEHQKLRLECLYGCCKTKPCWFCFWLYFMLCLHCCCFWVSFLSTFLSILWPVDSDTVTNVACAVTADQFQICAGWGPWLTLWCTCKATIFLGGRGGGYILETCEQFSFLKR